MTDIPSLIERIFKEHLRLICKECHAGVCDCSWMVKPGSIEECAKKAAEALIAFPLPDKVLELAKWLRERGSNPQFEQAAYALENSIFACRTERDALLAARASSLPEEVAGNVDSLQLHAVWLDKYFRTASAAMCRKAASFLERMARQNGLLMNLDQTRSKQIQEFSDEINQRGARIAELERIFDTQWDCSQRAIKMWQTANPGNDMVWPDKTKLLMWLMDRIAELEAELHSARIRHDLFVDVAKSQADAIKAKTIEECAVALERTHVSGGLLTPAAAAVRIRALSQPAGE